MWVSIVFAVIGILIVLLCIGSLINMIWAKKKCKNKTKATENTDTELVLLREKNEKINKQIAVENEKNSDVDLSSLPFCIEFKKEFKQDFFEFKKQFFESKSAKHKSLHTYSIDSKSNGYTNERVILFGESYFLVGRSFVSSEDDYNYLEIANENNKPSTVLHRFTPASIAVVLLKNLKTDAYISILNTLTIEEFKQSLFPIDSLLYIEYLQNIQTETHTIASAQKTPSKLNLAVTEAVWGTAVAVSKANNASKQNDFTYTTSKNLSKYGFMFNPLTKLPKLFLTSYDVENDKYLVELKSHKTLESYQIQTMQNTSKQSTDKSISEKSEELRTLKQLLSDGIITQEEFDVQKKRILENK